MGRVDGKVALITGAARGQGRSHAVRLAEEGADIIAVDLLEQIATVNYSLAGQADMDETVHLVEKLDRRIVAVRADVRSQSAMDAAVATGLQELGHIDIVCANAGIASMAATWELSETAWQDVIDTNLTGVWHTVKAAVPSMIDAGRGGSIVLTSSVAGVRGMATLGHYSAAKHGLVGLMQTLAKELAPHRIRVNTVHPTNVATDMILNDTTFRQFHPDLENPSEQDMMESMAEMNLLPVPWVDPVDVSNAILWLSSDEARYVTGVALPIDAGMLLK